MMLFVSIVSLMTGCVFGVGLMCLLLVSRTHELTDETRYQGLAATRF